MTMSYYKTPFHLIQDLGMVPFRSSVYVVSDSTYKEYKTKEAKAEIARLEARAEDYRKTVKVIEDQIAHIQKQAGLLPESEEKELPN